MNITKQQFVDMVENAVKGTTHITVDSCTEVRMNKSSRLTGIPNPYGKVLKYQSKNGQIGWEYFNAVNNEALREDKEIRQVKTRTWGTLSNNRFWVHHTNKQGEFKTYLQLRLLSTDNTHYFAEDGTELTLAQISEYMPPQHVSSTQADLNKNIEVNDIDLDHIIRVRMLKDEFTFVSINSLPAVRTVNSVTTTV